MRPRAGDHEQPSRDRPTVANPLLDGPGVLVLALGPSVSAADPAALTDRARSLLLDSGAGRLEFDVGDLAELDLAVVDALARLALGARRAGCEVSLLHASPALVDLLAWTGLARIVGCAPELCDPAPGLGGRRDR